MGPIKWIFLLFLFKLRPNEAQPYDIACEIQGINTHCQLKSYENTILNINICSTNPEIVSLQITELNIQSSIATVFEKCSKLKVLNMSSNRLEILPIRVFHGAPLLENVNLSRNLIKLLPLDIFDTLSNLKRLDLSHNRLNHLSPGTFKNQHKLQHLSITGNPLMQIDVEKIRQYANMLQEIDMTDTFLPCERLERIQSFLRQTNVSILMSTSKHEIDVDTMKNNEIKNYDVTFLNNATCLNDEQYKYRILLMAPMDEQVSKLLYDMRVVKRNQDKLINRLLEMENNFKFLEQGLVKIMTEMRQEMNQLKISIEDSEKAKKL